MKLSAPIHILKSKAKKLKTADGISMVQALDLVARHEGFSSWSLLMSKAAGLPPSSYGEVLDFLNPGDLIIVAARPSMGKTSFSVGLFVKAIQQKRSVSFYFTLAETHMDVAGRIGLYDKTIGEDENIFKLDYSNDICADYIISKSREGVGRGSLIIVDYLQLLDEKRTNPPLQNQIEKLKAFAMEKGCVIVFLSQARREIEYKTDRIPSIEDIRLPNPLDLKFFNKIILLHRKTGDAKEVDVIFTGKTNHQFKAGWNKEKVAFFKNVRRRACL